MSIEDENDNKDQNELFAEAINTITAKLCDELLKEFSKLSPELQKGLVLIKSSQLMLANVLCHIALNKKELEDLISTQGQEIKDLTWDCMVTGFAKKFEVMEH